MEMGKPDPTSVVHEIVLLGHLEIDQEGRVWRVMERRGQSVFAVPRRRAEHRSPHYLQVRVMVGGVRYHACAHRVVWVHHNGPIPHGMEINHINGVKTDNRPANLEMVTRSKNVKHAVRVLKVARAANQYGQKNHAAKLTDAEVEAIRAEYVAGQVTQKSIAERFGVSHQSVSKILRGDRRKLQGGPTGDWTANRYRGGLRVREVPS